jgi:hypothetical protein
MPLPSIAIATLLVSLSLIDVTLAQPSPVPYTDEEGVNLLLYPYVGTNVALMSRNALDPAVAARIVQTIDQAFDVYAAATGRRPSPFKTYSGRDTVADVPHACGGGCSYVGATGIEILNPYFDYLYTNVRDHGLYDQVVFYELGRNFWFYDKKIAYKEGPGLGVLSTGYAVFMRFYSVAVSNVAMAPVIIGTGALVPYTDVVNEVIALRTYYLADPTMTWANTLYANRAPANKYALGATDLLASFIFELWAQYGDSFVNNLWKEVGKRPDAVTTQDAVDNFVLAASAAAGEDLTLRFQAWRWPVSDKAVDEANARFDGKVVEFYNASLDHYFITVDKQEILDLDTGVHQGWARTSLSFNAYNAPTAGANAVCRFYIPPGLGDSHFFSASPQECAETRSKFPSLTLESASAFYIALPDTTTGACPTGTRAVYRLWNQRSDSNHRYTSDPAVKAQMIARGYVAEGYGPDAVSMCATGS